MRSIKLYAFVVQHARKVVTDETKFGGFRLLETPPFASQNLGKVARPLRQRPEPLPNDP